jgi:hypothetical protein
VEVPTGRLHKYESRRQKNHPDTMVAAAKEPRKKKPSKLVKPNTRSSSKQFESDAAEVNALVRTLKHHLATNVTDEEIPQVDREQLNTEIKEITENVSAKRTTVGKILPRLRDIARTTTLPGAFKTSKGIWLYSEAIRAEGQEDEEPGSRHNKNETITPKSPDLLESASSSQTTDESDDTKTTRARELSVEETKEAQNDPDITIETKSQNLESNPYYKLQGGEYGDFTNDSDSTNSSRNEAETQTFL